MRFILLSSLLLATLAFATASTAAPSARQTCKKMIADGRGGVFSQSKCECAYRVADAVLDDDLKALLFDAWYNGTNNMAAMEKLPGRKRIQKQLETMRITTELNCTS